MTTFDLVGAACWVLMSLAFILTRSHVSVFNVICALLLLAAFSVAVFGPEAPRRADEAALLSGLAAYWAGLLILRAMLTRSVSVELLIARSQAQDHDTFDERIARRVDEAVKYRLMRQESGLLMLTPAGDALAVVLARLYRAVGVD